MSFMQVGIQFFPDIGPDVKSARDYWQEALCLVGLCDRYGYTHVRTVEHYFHPYGGYSPNPVVFLAAAAQVTRHARLVTGAVLPAFNNPLKLAGELGDAGRAVRRPPRHRLRAGVPAARILSIWREARREPGAVRGRRGAGAASARAGERHRRGALS